MNDAGLQSRSSRVGRSSSFFPSSIRAIFCSAGSLASTVRSAGSSVVSSVASTITTASEDRQREQVQWAGFDRIELGPANIRHVLLLTYLKGFQVWDVEDADDVWKLVSKGDGPVACLRVQPQLSVGMFDGGLNAARPLLLVVTTDATNCRSTGIPSGLPNGYGRVVGSPPSVGDNHFVPTLVKFYSLRSHTYVHTLRFRTAIYAVRCSSRVVAVALATQLYCFDAATLQSTFSVLTYPSPQPGSSGLNFGYGAVAVGPRWLAYAANQPVVSNTGRVSPQHLTPSPGVSPSTSPANGSLVACYAKESSKQLAAGIVTLGYKTFSRYCTEGIGSPELGSPLQKNSCNGHPEHAGTVIVRDFVSKVVVSQFRAHRSPLSALCFDPTGTLLVTASIRGHNINIFRIMPVSNVNGANSSSYDASASHVHLYKLSRGMTNAVIQDIAFTEDSHWIVVSSSRGTNHLFAISPFGGAVGPSTHGPGPVDQAVGTFAPMRLLPWWSNMGPVRSSQQASSNPPPTVSSSVVSRIKNGNGGWGGTVSGAAAAAAATSGRTCSSLGAVAVFFHDGRGHKLDTEAGQTILKEQLWVLFPSGHLIRYALHLSAGAEGYPDNVSSAMAPGSPKETLDLRVVEKPLQKWDVCRRQNWVEREEKIDIPSSLDAAHEEAGTSSGTSIGLYNNGALGRELMTPEEMHRWFLSNAEVQMHHFRPTLWAKSQISFHVFAGVAHSRVFEKEDSGGEVEIEKVLTHVVEVRKKDLVPFDRLRNYQFGEDARDTNMLLRGTLNSSSLHSGMQYGFIGTDVGGIHIQRSSSGSSCGSDGSSYSGPNVGQNSVHHSHQDSPQDLQIQSLPFSFPHQSKQNQFYVKKTEVQGTHFPSVDSMKENKNVIPTSLGSPLVDIPYLSHQDSHDRSPKPGEKPEINCPVGQELQERERAILPLQGEGEGAMMKIESSCDVNLPCEGQVDVGSIPNGYFTSQGVFKHTDPAAIRSDNQRVAPAVEGACLHTLQTPDLDQAFGRVFSDTLNHVGKFDLQDNDAATEDVESTGGNSKSEDFGGEQGEDGWEGDIFPFAEDC